MTQEMKQQLYLLSEKFNRYILEKWRSNIMEYYAKSKEGRNSEKKKKKCESLLQEILQEPSYDLEEWETRILENEIEKIYIENTEIQKTLKEHEQDIVACAETFFEKYGQYFTEKEKKLIIEACRIHDWGKTNLLFQAVVNEEVKTELTIQDKKKKQIPHGFLSALSISLDEFLQITDCLKKEDFDTFLTAVYYHHTRTDEWENAEIKEYAEQYYREHLEKYLGREKVLIRSTYRRKLLFRNSNNYKNLPLKWEKWILYSTIKGMLNKFDYTVSAGYENAETNPDLEKRQLIKNIEEAFKNYNLRPVQTYMKENSEQNLVVIAPTGSGKTEAALLWLNGEKGFYTLPLKVSSNAIYERIKVRYGYEDVALLHSDSMQVYLKESEDKDAYKKYERAKLLANPLTICTVDQLFKFVYKALGTEIFPATLKYSKIILDEIQAYSPQVLAAIIYGLKQVTAMGGKFAIITATFPPVLEHFMKQHGLLKGENYQFQDFSDSSDWLRHKVDIRDGEMNLDEIVEQGLEKKVLIICNTVSKAQQIYKELEERTEEVYLLHSRYIRRDRNQLENMIMKFSEDREAVGIWVTTQLVEASLDIDFDILYTEMCTADSLLQRMGRCNRKARYQPQEANVIVYANKNGVGNKSVYEEELYFRSLDKLRQYAGKMLSEKEKIDYINQVYCTEEIMDTSYYKEIEKYLEHFEELTPLEYSKHETDKEFRNIQSITVVPDSIYDENQRVFEKSIEVLECPYMGRNVKSVFTTKSNDLTLNLNRYRNMNGVDVATVGEKGIRKILDIHRTSLKYEFDRETGKGQGLLLRQVEDEQFFI